MKPPVAIVVVPRERFSSAQESLESVYTNTDTNFELVYVDGRSPPSVRRYLAGAAARYGFSLVRFDRYLMPNQARNIGLARARTPYVVFLDNDVIVSPGWLSPLVECAEETGAWAVGPITCIGRPEEGLVHLTTGKLHFREELDGTRIEEEMVHRHEPLAVVRGQLERQRCDMLEFHTLLVRREVFDTLGPLDEGMIVTREHTDLCLAVNRAGGTVYFEPRSLVTHVPPWVRFEASDLPYYLLRWSNQSARATQRHFKEKWGLAAQDDRHIDHWITPHRRVVFGAIEKRLPSAPLRRFIGRPIALTVALALEAVLTPLARIRAGPPHPHPRP